LVNKHLFSAGPETNSDRNLLSDELNIKSFVFMFISPLFLFSTYCAIWVRRSNFRHHVSPRESTQRRKVELCAEKCPGNFA